jgi:hypothetical protein
LIINLVARYPFRLERVLLGAGARTVDTSVGPILPLSSSSTAYHHGVKGDIEGIFLGNRIISDCVAGFCQSGNDVFSHETRIRDRMVTERF